MSKPSWDPKTKKLSGHYDYDNVRVIFDALENTELEHKQSDKTFVLDSSHLNQFVLKIARMLGLRPRSRDEVPAAIRKWASRTFKIYIHPELYRAYVYKNLSMRYLYDIVDYSQSVRFNAALNKAIAGQITNTQFRTLVKGKQSEKLSSK